MNHAMRRAGLLALAATLLLIPLAFFEVVFAGKTLSTAAEVRSINGDRPPTGMPLEQIGRDLYRLDPGASAWQSEPWTRVINRSLAEGRAPLWNPHQGTGNPLAANMQSAALDPLFAPAAARPTPAVWDAVLLATMALGALGMYAAGRVLGLAPIASVTGVAAYSLSGFFMLYSNNMAFRPYVMLPVLILLVERTVARASWIWPVGLAFAAAETVLMGFAPASAFVLGAATAFGLWRMVRARAGRGSVAVRLAAAAALGAALTAPLVLLLAEYVPRAHTIHGAASQLGRESLEARTAVGWLLPFLNGAPRDPVVGTGFSGTADWVGVAAFMLALVPLAVPRARRVGHPVFFLTLSGFLFLKMYGVPVVAWIGDLPIANRVQWARYGLPVAAFGLAIAAASGVHALMQGVDRRRLARVWAVALGIIAALVAWNARSVRADGPNAGRQILLAYIAVVLVGAIAMKVRGPRAGIVTLVVIAELMILVPRGIYSARHDPFTPPAWLAPLRAGLATEPGARTFSQSGVAWPDTPAGAGLYDIRSIDALQPERFATYIRAFVEPEMAQRFAGMAYGRTSTREATPALIEDNPMYDLLGVRWLLLSPSWKGPPDYDRYRFVSVNPGSSVLGGGVDYRDDVAVYEDTRRTPRAFVVGAAERVGSQDEALALFKARSVPRADGTLVVKDLDPRETAVVEAPATALGIPGAAARASGTAKITRYLADEVAITVQSDAPGLLILTDTYFPGWRATVNGADAPVYPADILFRAIPVQAGTSTVQLRYRPAGFRAGLVVASIALLAAIALVVVERRRRPKVTTR